MMNNSPSSTSVYSRIIFKKETKETEISKKMYHLISFLTDSGSVIVDAGDIDILKNGQSHSTEWANRAVILDDKMSIYPMMIEPLWFAGESVHSLRILCGGNLNTDEYPIEWKRICHYTEKVTEFLEPDFSYCYAKKSDNFKDPIMFEKQNDLNGQYFILPWTYFSKSVLKLNINIFQDYSDMISLREFDNGVVIAISSLPGDAQAFKKASSALADLSFVYVDPAVAAESGKD